MNGMSQERATHLCKYVCFVHLFAHSDSDASFVEVFLHLYRSLMYVSLHTYSHVTRVNGMSQERA